MISIIVPAYNAERFLVPTLESVRAQTYTNWELIVVNDGSTDRTEAVARNFAQGDSRVQVFTKANGGCGAARNYGVERTDPAFEYIIFLDHDDLWESIALESLLHAAQNLPDGVGAYGAALVLNAAPGQSPPASSRAEQMPNKPTPVSTSAPGEADDLNAAPLTFADLVTFNRIWTMGQVLIRRAALLAVGPLDPASAPADDWDIYLRLTLRGPLAVTNAIVIQWRSHAGNTSKNKLLMDQAQDYVRSKLLNSEELTEEQRRFAAECFQNARRNLSASQMQWAKECLARRQYGEALKQTRRALTNYARSLTSAGH